MDTVIVIPSKRPPPIKTLESYTIPDGYEVLVVADPSVLVEHTKHYKNNVRVRVFNGLPGQGANKSRCYEIAYHAGYEYMFRMDDDLMPKTFVGIEKGSYPGLREVIEACRECLDETETTLVGPFNGSNRYWMSREHKRTYGLIHGGANLSITMEDGSKYLDSSITRGEDVYRTCSHRFDAEGYVGRVGGIGFDKRGSTQVGNQTSISVSQEAIDASTKLILEKFPTMVSCDGTRWILGGKYEIPNWRMLRP